MTGSDNFAPPSGQKPHRQVQQQAQLQTPQSARMSIDRKLEYSYEQGLAFDEMVDEGTVRPHWTHFLQMLNHSTAEDLRRIRIEASRFLRENGVIYNKLHDDIETSQITWELDPVPVLVGAPQWQQLERGLKQRARLFELILKDFYGEQKLLTEGIIPPECIFLHSGFLRPVIGSIPDVAISLPTMACDFVRGADGMPRIVADKVQTPSGVGHSLENRLLISNLLPDEFRQMRTVRVAAYFGALKAGLQALTPRAIENPRVVVLTPGPSCKTYFEHAYLASYLGYHLALGDDLAVQDGIVWLKSLEGLKRVDVILRYVADSACDPVELQSDSILGIPGLLEAVRQRNVAIANPLGSGLLENPALYPYLQAISQYFLNESLELPSIATWWCGEATAKKHVINNITSLVIKSIDHHRPTVFGSELNDTERSKLIDEINTEPHKFVGQEVILYGTSPSLKDDKLLASQIRLRMFISANSSGDHIVMPGGMARIVDVNTLSDDTPGISKDIWVANDDASAAQDSSTHRSKVFNTQRIKELDSVLPSRAAETLFWAGCYLERAERIARQLRLLITELNGVGSIEEWENDLYLHLLFNSLHIDTSGTEIPDQNLGKTQFSIKKAFNEIRSLMVDPHRDGSLITALNNFTQSSFGVRDLWSSDSWRTIDEINSHINALSHSPINRFSWQKRIDSVISSLMSFIGLVSESMVHENSWRMLEIGRNIERIRSQSSLLHFFFVYEYDDVTQSTLSEASLRLYESLIIHRRRYRNVPQTQDVIDLLLIDTENPRSLAYQIEKIKSHIDRLPLDKNQKQLSETQAICLRASTSIQLAALNSLNDVESGERHSFSTLLKSLCAEMNTLSEVLAHKYFSHTQPSHQLLSTITSNSPVLVDGDIEDSDEPKDDILNIDTHEKDVLNNGKISGNADNRGTE